MSELVDQLKAVRKAKSRVPVTIPLIMAELENTDKAAKKEFEEALADTKRVSSYRLADVMTTAGYPVSAATIAGHRRRAQAAQPKV